VLNARKSSLQPKETIKIMDYSAKMQYRLMLTPIEKTNLQSESADSEMVNSHRPFKPMLN